MLARIGTYILERFREASTWRGLIKIFMAAGMVIKPQMAEAIIAFGLAMLGGVAVATPDRMRADPPPGDRVPAGGDVDLAVLALTYAAPLHHSQRPPHE